MNSIYLLLISIVLFLSACGDATPTQEAPSTKETPTPAVVTESGTAATPTPTETVPTAQPVVNRGENTFADEQRKIDAAVGNINENIGSYTKERTTVQYQEAEYTVVKYKDKNGFIVKSEATGGTRNWEFFALPKAASQDQLIYGTYYQKTDNPYAPITRSIYHLGSLTDLEPKSMLFIDQDGATVQGEPLYQDEKDYKAALAAFLK
ncbi:MAG: hypothetical protein ACRBFS_24750 [Aureispira sp.]